MTGYSDQVTRELLALTEPDPMGTGLDRAKVRRMLADAWDVGYRTGGEDVDGRPADPVGNPFEAWWQRA